MLNEYIKKSIGNVSCPRSSGKVAAVAVGRGECEQKRKKSFLRKVTKYLPVILERRKNDVGNRRIKKVRGRVKNLGNEYGC